jgi:quinol monooxygenase YgiN
MRENGQASYTEAEAVASSGTLGPSHREEAPMTDRDGPRSTARRRLLGRTLTVLASALVAPRARAAQPAVAASLVRLSRGSFPAERYDAVRARLAAAEATLVPAIRALPGLLHYHAAIDRASSSMVNVSVWRSLAEAQQMQTLAPMLALAEEFTREGVVFERPIPSYETLWSIG